MVSKQHTKKHRMDSPGLTHISHTYSTLYRNAVMLLIDVRSSVHKEATMKRHVNV
jgi:hypothetical protein